MVKCSSCGRECAEKALISTLVKRIDCCTSESETEEISEDFVCSSCIKEDDYDLGDFGFCEFDDEKNYAMHISDLKSHENILEKLAWRKKKQWVRTAISNILISKSALLYEKIRLCHGC